MIEEIISINSKGGCRLRHNFRANSGVFKDNEFKTDAKTNSGHRVRLLLVGSPLLACTEHTQSPLFARTCARSLTIADNFGEKIW